MNSHDNPSHPPRLDIIPAVLESAFNAGAQVYVAACRRLLRADLIGWRRDADREDWKAMVWAHGKSTVDLALGVL